jgi:hypothetical protein
VEPDCGAVIGLSTALVAFFLLYASPFTTSAPVTAFVPTPKGKPGAH